MRWDFLDAVQRILDLMDKHNINAAQLQRNAKLSPSLITQWKKGLFKPSYGALVKIANYFNVSVEYLECKTDDPNPADMPSPKTEFPPDFSYSFYSGYKELNDDNRALLHDLMEKMRLSQKASEKAQD